MTCLSRVPIALATVQLALSRGESAKRTTWYQYSTRLCPPNSSQKQLFVGIQNREFQGTWNQSLATWVELGFLGSLGPVEVPKTTLLNFPKPDFWGVRAAITCLVQVVLQVTENEWA